MGTSPESPRKKISRFSGTEQHDDEAGKVLQRIGPERSGCVGDAGNGREWNVDMPDNAEGRKDWAKSAAGEVEVDRKNRRERPRTSTSALDIGKVPEGLAEGKTSFQTRGPEAGQHWRDAGETTGTGKRSGGSIGNHPSRSGSIVKYPIGTMTYLTLDKLPAFVKVSGRRKVDLKHVTRAREPDWKVRSARGSRRTARPHTVSPCMVTTVTRNTTSKCCLNPSE
ncbi:hypothetical protein DFH07DRAFT_947436 [Mycena maculata]|uniref:Uncharacterized protein n=1 Tax=Mycena maculata TaxID=230809 RepID=A0AAD7HDV2_9AGAR|nr:hypothetical protein DFH07DRAFT_947436 [Mycena maculata]